MQVSPAYTFLLLYCASADQLQCNTIRYASLFGSAHVLVSVLTAFCGHS